MGTCSQCFQVVRCIRQQTIRRTRGLRCTASRTRSPKTIPPSTVPHCRTPPHWPSHHCGRLDSRHPPLTAPSRVHAQCGMSLHHRHDRPTRLANTWRLCPGRCRPPSGDRRALQLPVERAKLQTLPDITHRQDWGFVGMPAARFPVSPRQSTAAGPHGRTILPRRRQRTAPLRTGLQYWQHRARLYGPRRTDAAPPAAYSSAPHQATVLAHRARLYGPRRRQPQMLPYSRLELLEESLSATEESSRREPSSSSAEPS